MDSLGAPLSCVRCGYELAGLEITSVCPECGVPVRQTWLQARQIDRRGVRNIRAGLWLLLASLLIVPLGLMAAWSQIGGTWPRGLVGALVWVLYGGVACWPAGWWLTTMASVRGADRQLAQRILIGIATPGVVAMGLAIWGVDITPVIAMLTIPLGGVALVWSWVIGFQTPADIASAIEEPGTQRAARFTAIAVLPLFMVVCFALVFVSPIAVQLAFVAGCAWGGWVVWMVLRALRHRVG